MSASKGGQGNAGGSGRSPRPKNADVTERHLAQGMPPATGTDASTAARGTKSGGNDSAMADPDAPTAGRPSGRSASRMGEGRSAGAGAAQGQGAGARRRSGSDGTSKGTSRGSSNKPAQQVTPRSTHRGSNRGR